MVKIKICGLKRPCDVRWVNEAQADFAGFVFAGKKRRIDDETAASLRALLEPEIPAVGVFVNDDPEHVARLVRTGTIQLVQLHGQEDESYIKQLRALIDVPLIQAFSIASAQDIRAAVNSTADFILLDHGKGGSGQSFDWSLAALLQRPFFLAGGLTPENVKKALCLAPYALDVSSGVETNGVKDREKIMKFMAQARSCVPEEETT